MTDNSKKIVIIFLVISISLFGMFLRLEKRADSLLWTDEIAQISAIKLPYPQMLEKARTILQVPGDYVVIKPFYDAFGENKWALAVPHLIATLIGFVLFYFLCAQYFSTVVAYVIAFFMFAWHSTLIHHALEIRPYSVLVTLSIASFLVMKMIVEKTTLSARQIFLASIVIVLTFSFHLYGILMLGLPFIFHLLFSRGKQEWFDVIGRNLRYFFPALLIGLPIWGYYSLTADKSYMGPSCDGGTFAFTGHGIKNVLKAIVGNLLGGRKIFYVFLLGFGALLLSQNKDRFKQLGFLITLIIIPISFILYTCVHYQYWFVQRLFVFCMPYFIFLIAWQWDTMIQLILKNRNYANAR